MTPLSRIAIVLSFPVLTACGGRSDSPQVGQFIPRSSPNVLTAYEASGFADAYQAVQGLRSRWLRTRAPDGFALPGQVWIYRDGMRVGGVESLRSMSTLGIAALRYYDGLTASQRWRVGHEDRVIEVTSKTQ